MIGKVEGAPGFVKLGQELAVIAKGGPQTLKDVVRHYGYLGLGKVKGLASTGTHKPGRPHIPGTGPGPNRATGDYTRTMNVQFISGPDGTQASIGTNADQARRLELGFNGVDSIGRHYEQDAFPHWEPMADWLEREVDGATQVAFDRIMGR